jgi:hypothetical protein
VQFQRAAVCSQIVSHTYDLDHFKDVIPLTKFASSGDLYDKIYNAVVTNDQINFMA